MLKQIRWGWVLLGGFVAEIALFLFVPLQFLPGGPTLLLYLVVPLCLLVTGIAGWWIARRASSARVLHGALVGVVAFAIYVALTWTTELPAVYVVANYLKIVGGMAGGWYADRRRAPQVPQAGAAGRG
jgi:uncharacterized protein YneF (UPF0154 family)